MTRDERHDLVDLDGTPLRTDVRYARADNFLGYPVYPMEKAFLQRPVYESLLRAHRALARHGFGILVFDGYRPWSVTKLFYDRATDAQRAFLANPETGSAHNRGCAVDCSLFELATGREVRMPSAFDEMNETAWADYAGGEAEARARRDLLIDAMHAERFKVIRIEWWHFNHEAIADYPIYDLPFERVLADIHARGDFRAAGLPG
jgi:D-alanyl-D-alanine dipeptidase